MSKKMRQFQFAGFIFTSLAGTLLHFLYDLSGKSVITALFSAVNESIWEHMKLLFFPLFIFTLIEYRYLKDETENLLCIKLKGITIGLITIPILYYTYTGILGTSADWFNICIFYISAAVAFLSESRIIKKDGAHCPSSAVSFIIICIIGILFILFTFAPPKIPLFADPITGEYGIQFANSLKV